MMQKKRISLTLMTVLSTLMLSATAETGKKHKSSTVAAMFKQKEKEQDDGESLERMTPARLGYCTRQFQRCTDGLILGIKYYQCGAAFDYCRGQGVFDLPGGASNHDW